MPLLAIWRIARPFLPYILAAAAIIGAHFWLDHRAFQRGYDAKNAEVIVAANRLAEAAKRSNARLATVAAERDTALNSRLDTTQAEGARQQTIIIRETATEPRYRDVACSLTPPVAEAINAARRLSAKVEP